MSIQRRFMNVLFGERSPSEIVVTRSVGETTFRLPDQFPAWNARLPVLLVLVAIGAYGIFLVVNGSWRFAENDRQPIYVAAGVALIVVAVICVFVRTRTRWHYEITLSPLVLSVNYFAFGQRYCTASIKVTPMRQLTIVRKGPKSLLQAESSDDSIRLILREQEHDTLMQLADLMVKEHATFEPGQPAWRVVVEDPAHVQDDRPEAPIGCKITLTRHEDGIFFDFPLAPDPRENARRRAWLIFEVGILTLVGTVMLYGFFVVFQNEDLLVFLLPPFIAGLVCLATASGQSWKAWLDHAPDNEMRQLSVADNLLIQTLRDHRKQVWYRDEIRFIAVVECGIVTTSSGEGGIYNTVEYYFQLIVYLRDGKSVILHGVDAAFALADYRPKAELEWVATELRKALSKDYPEPPELPVNDASQAIQAHEPRVTDERITQ